MTTKTTHTPKYCRECEQDDPDGLDTAIRLCPLHAAAPDLLEAVKKALEVVEKYGVQYPIWPMLRAAIDRAEGR